MLRILHQIWRTGVVTEPLPPLEEGRVTLAGERLEEEILNRFRGSLAVRFVDAGSCNACELEITAVNNPFYDCERFGIHFTASPRFADMLLVTGPVARNMEIALRRTYDAMPGPKLVVAVGDCAYDCGVFGRSYATLSSVADVVPVSAFIHGCPPPPAAILGGIMAAIGKIAAGR